MYNSNKIKKIRKQISETEDNDEKKILLKYLSQKTNVVLDINSNDDPLINIIKKEDLNLLKKILIKTKVKWEKYIFYQTPPLHVAIDNGDLDAIKLLLFNNYSIWLPDKNNITPLELGCINKDSLIINLLIDYGANIKKILYLRENHRDLMFYNTNIDFIILAKQILMIENDIFLIRKRINNRNKIETNIEINDSLIGLEDFTWDELLYGLYLFVRKEYPDLLSMVSDFNNHNMDDFIIFTFLFKINFNFNIENEKYFFNELKYNRIIIKDLDKLKIKFFDDFSNIYHNKFLELIWYKYLIKIK